MDNSQLNGLYERQAELQQEIDKFGQEPDYNDQEFQNLIEVLDFLNEKIYQIENE
jgi:hypothetical protein